MFMRSSSLSFCFVKKQVEYTKLDYRVFEVRANITRVEVAHLAQPQIVATANTESDLTYVTQTHSK